eukprot:3337445-Pleurochrysis_carterae.AAC.15
MVADAIEELFQSKERVGKVSTNILVCHTHTSQSSRARGSAHHAWPHELSARAHYMWRSTHRCTDAREHMYTQARSRTRAHACTRAAPLGRYLACTRGYGCIQSRTNALPDEFAIIFVSFGAHSRTLQVSNCS